VRGSANAASAALNQRLSEEQAKARKLEIIFGKWWQHYAVPYEFRWTLYTEHSACPYCGGSLGPINTVEGLPAHVEPEMASAHIDHMDSLSKGGEESIRNAVYVCAGCNLAKRNQLFVDWLELLTPEFRQNASLIYLKKHGHPPNAFKPTTKQVRLTLPRLELQLDETVLRKLFPKPIVSGPPGHGS